MTEADALADAELKLTNSVLTYARHAQTGRVHFSRISADILYLPTAPEPAEVLANMAGAKNVGEALDSYNPPQPGYKALKAKLADARAKKGDTGPVRIEKGPVLKFVKDKKGKEIVMEDARVPQLRGRFGIAAEDNTTYDKPLSDAVAKFQRQHGLPVSGQLNQATIDALNGPRRDRDADVIVANLERWRWMPRDLGKIYVMVNIPDFTLKVVRDGAMVWTTRIVTGKPHLATPITSAYMQFITVNPTWNVPPSIIANEYIPALQQDPQAMTRIGLKVTENPDGTIHIYQPPGDANALGRIRFNFPNKFLVYQHDTPDKHLFAHEKRAYSHGCMRVQDPLKYAEVLLGIVMPKEGYTQERLRKMFGSAEVDIRFPPSSYIPVHLTYQTAFVDDAGKLVIREDVYGRDARILAALKGDERRVADVAIERSPSGSGVRRDALRLPGGYYGGSNRNSFEDFFRRVFR
jgi:murein L,D-transpeptidase YcbB/YkuD